MVQPIPFRPKPRPAARSAVVVGAGIGGLACALTLRRAGLTVQVVEQARKLKEVGAGLQLTPNATRIIRDLGLLPRLEAVAVTPRSLDVRDGRSGSTITRAHYGPATTRYGAPFLVVHRADLQNLLADAAREAGVIIALGADLTAVEPAFGGVRAVVKQGGNLYAHGADILVGADGVRSAVRAHLGVARPPVFARRLAYRATVPVPARHPPDVRLYLGPDAHLVAYPVKGGATLNLVAIVKQEEPVARWSAPGDSAAVHAAFARWAPEVRSLLESAPHFLCWGLYDIDPLPRWGSGRVTLLGDAAHAMLPFLAQGAAQAIEDAASLASAILRETDAAAALRAYEAERRARTARIQNEARRNGLVYHLSGPPRIARDLVLRRSGAGLLDRYGWIYKQ
ncbi:FAD-dependent monooxygenase [Xanthobacter dioxanivorans]|uniref:FAD-dependent monooxygenase n=1 Tax=Xanthobacter dioxanivorans TaxID=2528964 RepID=A0A974PJU4_9HYPH|nr:FAD-dependent monooxygenase [Xanthobacter dioxanivorans]QRG04905.1 FAD-dependent monooxygenase [Xanthobacter dioxanivorans]